MVTERRVRPMVRIEKGYVLKARSRVRTEAAGEDAEPKLIPAIAAHACSYPALVTTSTSHVIEVGTSRASRSAGIWATAGNSGTEGTSCGYDSSESTPLLATRPRFGTPTPTSM